MIASGAAMRGRVTGIGGVFVRSADPAALMDWYRDVLGLDVAAWGGAMMRYDAPGHPPVMTFTAFDRDGGHAPPSTRDFMLNLAVDDLAAMLERIEAVGVAILDRNDDEPNGRFAWIMDPDGTKIELWEPMEKRIAG